MKIGLLHCDTFAAEIIEEFGDYPAMFARGFRSIGEDVELVTYEVQSGHYPNSLDDVDGYLITGSRTSVYDDQPWIDDLKTFVAALHQAKKKTVGVCFGHQLIAASLGGEVVRAECGWTVGVHENVLTGSTTGAGSRYVQRGSLRLISSHQDQVQRVAPGSQVIATSDRCPVAMTCLGEHILTVQAHPEFAPAFALRLLENRREALGEEAYHQAAASLDGPIDSLNMMRWIVGFWRH